MIETKLAVARRKRSETQEEAAARAGVPVRSWEAWERTGESRRTPSAVACARILKAFPRLRLEDLTTDPYVEVLP